MRRPTHAPFALLVLVFVALCASRLLPVAAADFQVGVAVRDITPPVPYRMSGYFSERLSTGAHDPLQAKALVFAQGDTKAALVFCDVAGISLDVSRRARALASEQTGIPAAAIMIAATHSHTGPLYFGALRQHFHDLAVEREGTDPYEAHDYPKMLAERIAEAVAAAHADVSAASLAAGSAEQLGLSFNRRFHMRDGSVRFNPGKLNPNIVRVAGPIDPEVGLLLVRDTSGTPRAVLSVFALHLDTVGGTEYAADYPYYLENVLRDELGESVVSLFGAGTCGDINHVDVTHDRPQKGHQEAERIGAALGETVLAGLVDLREIATPQLAVRSVTIDAPLQQYDAARVEQAQADMQLVGTRELPFLQQVESYKVMALQLREGTMLPLEVQVFRLGQELAIVGLPGEIFVELGLAIKRQSPFDTTLVIELTNDAPGYIPTTKAFAEGSYETVNSRVVPGTGEELVATAVRLLNELAE